MCLFCFRLPRCLFRLDLFTRISLHHRLIIHPITFILDFYAGDHPLTLCTKVASFLLPDSRRDWGERKMCNWLTYMQEDCGKVLDNQCYNEKEIIMWNDLAMEVNIDLIESLFGKWDSAKMSNSQVS